MSRCYAFPKSNISISGGRQKRRECMRPFLFAQATLGDFDQDPIKLGGNLTGRFTMTVYLIITTVTLLNLLVAVVNQVYQETEENGNEEFMVYKARQTQRLMYVTTTKGWVRVKNSSCT